MEIKIYKTAAGKLPFLKWYNRVTDSITRAKIRMSLDRLEINHFGDVKSVGDGVHELRIHYGPGYRIYFGKENNQLILLLLGGDKGSQEKDIKKAKEYWKEYSNHA